MQSKKQSFKEALTNTAVGFECENDMPVKEDKDALYCSNCGFKH